MNAVELIQQLVDYVSEYGDVEVYVNQDIRPDVLSCIDKIICEDGHPDEVDRIILVVD